MLSGYVRPFPAPHLSSQKNTIRSVRACIQFIYVFAGMCVCLQGYRQLSVSIWKRPLCASFPTGPTRMWVWERKWLMRRGMLGRREGGSGVQLAQPWARRQAPARTHTHTHSLARINSEHVLYSQQRNSTVQRFNIENALQIRVGHRGRDPTAPSPIPSCTVTHWYAGCITAFTWLLYGFPLPFSCLMHSSWVDGWSVVCAEHLSTPLASFQCSALLWTYTGRLRLKGWK